MMKKSIAIATILTLLLAVCWGCYWLGLEQGAVRGLRRGQDLATRIQAAKKWAALELIRSGQVEKGVAYLDHSLDQDVIEMANALSLFPQAAEDRKNAAYFLSGVAYYRQEYPRMPYKGWGVTLRDSNMLARVDRILIESIKQPGDQEGSHPKGALPK
jgi:hypothetical protein